MSMKHISLLLSATSLLVASACGAPSDDSATGSEGQTLDLDDGILTVALAPTLEPISWVESGNELQGAAVDAAKALGEEMGVEVKLMPMSLDAMIPGLQSKKIDMALLTDSVERQATVDFVDYLSFFQTLVVKSDSPIEIESNEDLCGLSVGVSRGASTIPELDALSEDCEKAGADAIRIDVYDSQAAASIAVESGRTDGQLTSSISAQALVGEGDFKATGEINANYAGWVFAEDRTELRDGVLEAMTRLYDDGKLEPVVSEYDMGSTLMAPEVNKAENS